MSALSPATSRFAAISLMALLILFVIFYLLAPLAKLYAEKYEKAETLRQQLHRFEYLIANEQKINTELKRIEDLGAEGDLFLTGNKTAIASANLREFINEAVKNSGGQLVSSQDYEAEPIPSATAVGLRLQISGEVQNLVDFLYQLESARPIVFIDDLTVSSSSSRVRSSRARKRSQQSRRTTNSLDVRMDVVGYLAGEAR